MELQSQRAVGGRGPWEVCEKLESGSLSVLCQGAHSSGSLLFSDSLLRFRLSLQNGFPLSWVYTLGLQFQCSVEST